MINPAGTRRRLALTVLAVFAVLAMFVVRLVDIQLVRAGEIAEGAEDHLVRSDTVYGVRGSIVDSDGTVLADSVERFHITASPKRVDFGTTEINRDGERVDVPTSEAIAELAAITGDEPADLMARLTGALAADPESDYVVLSRAAPLGVVERVRELGIWWVYNEFLPARTYPNGALAGNLVGFVGTDGPLAGMELYLDECLAADNGTITYEAAENGMVLPGSEIVEDAPNDGATVRLTIDSDLQYYAQQALAKEGARLGADWATAAVVRVDDGHIMAMADWPAIDPNDLDSVPADDAGARSFVSPYEPGSIIKPFTFAGLFDAGLVSPRERLVVPPSYTDGLPSGKAIRDAWWHGEMRWTVAGVLADSSNIGTSMLSTRDSAQDRRDYLAAFGFDEPTDVGFLAESPGRVLELDELDTITNVTQQFGQGMTATSAQIASAYQALGNDGVRMPLTLVEGCEWPDGTVTHAPDGEPVRAVGADAARTTVAVLEQVVSQGSLSSRVDIPGYRIAAKTGTAEVASGGRYTDERIVSIAGLVPADDPEYVVVVTFAKPDTMRSSAAAAPAFTAIMQQVIKTYRIPPSEKASPKIPLTW